MRYARHNPFAVSSVGYKSCLIVVETPAPSGGRFHCTSRVVLGGRMNVPLPVVSAATAEEARSAALEAARRLIDGLDRAEPDSPG